MRKIRVSAALIGILLVGCGTPEPSPPAETQKPVTTNDVIQKIVPRDASIERSLDEGYLISIDEEKLGEDNYQHYEAMAERMGLSETPALYVDITEDRPAPRAEARFTREGQMFIVMNKSALIRWSTEQLLAVLGHELVHLKEKHVTAPNIAYAYNHPEVAIEHELEADKVGSGPLGSCNPQALEEAIALVIDIDKKDYLERNPGKSSDNYNALVSIDHPAWEQRKSQLDALIAHPPQECISRELH